MRAYAHQLVRSLLAQGTSRRCSFSTLKRDTIWRSSYPLSRSMATVPKLEDENTKVGHSRFIAEASGSDKWEDGVGNPGKGGEEATGDEVKGLTEGQGKLLPTSSHLFKLILPLTPTSPSALKPPPTVFLLHPSQPLSHLARLIGSSLAPAIPAISFRSISPDEPQHDEIEWSDSTDVGDFIKSAVSEEHFTIVLTPSNASDKNVKKGSKDTETATLSAKERKEPHPAAPVERVITVRVPSFRDRTQFLRRRLRIIGTELHNMKELKNVCDEEAHQGARRMALGGFGMLIVYWLGVARLTFFDYGWDVMEPITYLSGLSTVICGYLWFLYKGREVSYSSVLNQSVSKRRDALYKSRGLDIDRWIDLVTEQKALRREMNKIAEDYDVRWDGTSNGEHRPRDTMAQDEDRDKEKKKLEKQTNGEKEEGEEDDDEKDSAKRVDKLREDAREDQERHS